MLWLQLFKILSTFSVLYIFAAHFTCNSLYILPHYPTVPHPSLSPIITTICSATPLFSYIYQLVLFFQIQHIRNIIQYLSFSLMSFTWQENDFKQQNTINFKMPKSKAKLILYNYRHSYNIQLLKVVQHKSNQSRLMEQNRGS